MRCRHRSEPIEKIPCLPQGIFLWTRDIFLQRNRGRRTLLTDTVGFLFQQSAQRGLVDLGLLAGRFRFVGKGVKGPLLSGEEAYVECPLLWYKGYHAYLLRNDGSSTELSVTGEGFNGKVRVYLENAAGGDRILVSYDGTVIQQVTWIVSIISTVAGGAY